MSRIHDYAHQYFNQHYDILTDLYSRLLIEVRKTHDDNEDRRAARHAAFLTVLSHFELEDSRDYHMIEQYSEKHFEYPICKRFCKELMVCLQNGQKDGD